MGLFNRKRTRDDEIAYQEVLLVAEKECVDELVGKIYEAEMVYDENAAEIETLPIPFIEIFTRSRRTRLIDHCKELAREIKWRKKTAVNLLMSMNERHAFLDNPESEPPRWRWRKRQSGSESERAVEIQIAETELDIMKEAFAEQVKKTEAEDAATIAELEDQIAKSTRVLAQHRVDRNASP